MTSAAHHLLVLAEHLRDVPEPWAVELSARLDRFLAGDPADLSTALGLKVARGERCWRTTLALDRRDEMLRVIARRHFPDLARSQQADEIATALRRYATGPAWRNDRAAQACPYAEDQLRAGLWGVLSAIDNALSARRIRKILAASSPYSWPKRRAKLPPNTSKGRTWKR